MTTMQNNKSMNMLSNYLLRMDQNLGIDRRQNSLLTANENENNENDTDEVDTSDSDFGDPAKISVNINSETIDSLIKNPIIQDLNSFDFENSKRVYEGLQSRYASKNIFFSKLRNGKIDTEIGKQYLEEKNYWMKILHRVLSTIKFLPSRGMIFRGTTKKFGRNDNGNYLGLLELIAQFNPFLNNHLKKYGNPGRGNDSYLSSSICDEFIGVLSKHVRDFIGSEARSAKYFSISVDSTPDVSHLDQLTFILRYVICDDSPIERFITFISNTGHKAVDMETAVLKN
ncbi:unnamed protein product [Psylliodes chrysocephalus]|uniref:DUF4371 domain-containing protein n=1 Tax=Psylliodes chrysocephalus TaxID=3402493 RepID=A0A9P0D164_9CUCU|nr:unnamed protein product [Psylliodes chrysocephala]